MGQLVGQLCVACRGRIGWEGDGRFCPACGCPVHTACATAARSHAEGGCSACGAAAADVAPRREAAAREVARRAGAGRQRQGTWAVGGSIALIGVGLMQLVLGGSPPAGEDRHDARGRLLGPLVPIGIGAVGFVLALRHQSKKS